MSRSCSKCNFRGQCDSIGSWCLDYSEVESDDKLYAKVKDEYWDDEYREYMAAWYLYIGPFDDTEYIL